MERFLNKLICDKYQSYLVIKLNLKIAEHIFKMCQITLKIWQGFKIITLK